MRLIIAGLLATAFICPGCESGPGADKPQATTASAHPAVIAYYSGDSRLIDSYQVEQVSHIIFSFCHLKGDRLAVDDAADSVTIQKLVSLKSRNAKLKVLLSLGGWGGCEKCSPVFNDPAARAAFAGSARELMDFFQADGIDLDWEYPTIEGHPGHPYDSSDKKNFTALVRALRDSLGNEREVCFAAGGFDKYLYESVDWNSVMPLVDKVNLMSYDLVSGFSKVTGHHTPLYSNNNQKQSVDNAIRFFDSIGVPRTKIIVGAAFYAREWEDVANVNNGLYQSGNFISFISYHEFEQKLNERSGYKMFRDTVSKAPYAYNAGKRRFATFDDSISVAAKTEYVLENGLGGIMFWELPLDKKRNGLFQVIHNTIKSK